MRHIVTFNVDLPEVLAGTYGYIFQIKTTGPDAEQLIPGFWLARLDPEPPGHVVYSARVVERGFVCLDYQSTNPKAPAAHSAKLHLMRID